MTIMDEQTNPNPAPAGDQPAAPAPAAPEAPAAPAPAAPEAPAEGQN